MRASHLQCLLALIIGIQVALYLPDTYAQTLDLPVTREHRGLRIDVVSVTLQPANGSASIDPDSPAGPLFHLQVELSVENIIDPMLVFDAGMDEAITLQGFPVNGPYLVWGDEAVTTLDARASAEETGSAQQHLDDPLTLPYYGDRITGTLTFAVDAAEPGPNPALIVPHPDFGTLRLPLTASQGASETTSAAPQSPSDVLDLAIDALHVDDTGVTVDIVGRAGQWQAGNLAREPGFQPLNLSGMRLFIDGEAPIAPLFDNGVDGADAPGRYAPLVYLADTVIRHRVVFPTALASDAERLALVLPIPPPPGSDEKYAVLPLRGEGPWLPTSDVTTPEDEDTDNNGTVSDWSPPEEAPAEFSLPLPEPPQIDDALKQQAKALVQQQAEIAGIDNPESTPSADSATMRTLAPDSVVDAQISDKSEQHIWTLPGTSDPALETLHLIADNRHVRFSVQAEPGADPLLTRDNIASLFPILISGTLYVTVEARQPGTYRLARRPLDTEADPALSAGNARPRMQTREPDDSPAALDWLETIAGVPDDTVYSHRVALTGIDQQYAIDGLLDSQDDRDVIRLDVATPLRVTLEVTPKATLSLIEGGDKARSSPTRDRREVLTDVILPPGRTHLVVAPRGGVREPRAWQVHITTHAPPAPTHEREPNDDFARAHRLTPYIARTGRLPVRGDSDQYFFHWPGDAIARFDTTVPDDGDAPPLLLELTRGKVSIPLEKRGNGQFDAHLPAGYYTLAVSTKSPSLSLYRIALSHAVYADNSAGEDGLSLSPVSLPPLKPWFPYPQQLRISLPIDTPPDVPVRLSVHSAHDDVVAHISPATLAPGDPLTELDLHVQIRRDMQDSQRFPVILTIDSERGLRQLPLTFTTDASASPHSDAWHDARLPAPLLGALDFAQDKFGAMSKETYLFDGILDTAFVGGEATVELAGRPDTHVAGFLIDADGGAHNAASAVELSLSNDGENFTQIARVDIPRHRATLPVVLDTAQAATQARVVLLDERGRRGSRLSLLNVKVLTHDPAGSTVETGANLATESFGFETVRLEPSVAVYAVEHKRLAHVDAIDLEQVRWRKENAGISVSASVDGPWGPWQSLGDVQTARDAPARLTLPAPVPLRYLKLDVQTLSAEDIQVTGLHEVPHAADRPSILGEWGSADSRAALEWLNQAPLPDYTASSEPVVSGPGDGSLQSGDSVSGQVSYGTAARNTWQVAMPTDGSDLRLRFEGAPYFHARVTATDNDGAPLVPLEQRQGDGSLTLTFGAGSTPARFAVAVYDTPVYLMLVWDDSGSVARFVPSLEQLVRNLPFEFDTDAIQLSLLPIPAQTGDILFDGWSSDSYEIMAAMNRYIPSGQSALYAAVDAGLDALEEVDGRRALLVLSDAQGDRNAFPANHIEQRLQAVAPQSFIFDAGKDLAHGSEHHDHLQNWAAVTGGRYTLLSDPDQVPLAMQAVQGWLTAPLLYTLTLDSVQAVPGELVVSSADQQAADARNHLHVILDASGSMWKTLADGRSRIAVARESLERLIDAGLPEDVLFSLRVFGNRAARRCRSDLEIAPGPLQPDAIRSTIRAIDPKDRSKTPIADSLDAVTQDLGNAPGRRTVVLISDGEETCDGDPGEVIDRLIAEGIDLRLNIIGFDIDDTLARQFNDWAERGNGEFFRAADSDALAASLVVAARQPYSVIDAEGAIVARGRIDGDPISLPAGAWSVVFDDQQENSDPIPVEIRSGETTRVTR